MEYVENKEPCVDCGATFNRPKKRGRPPTRCESCRDKVEQVVYVPTEEEKVYNGPKAKLLGDYNDHPKGNEAQCVTCWRIFTSDSACEFHKDYRRNPICRDPSTLGMVARERRDIPIWTRPSNGKSFS